MIVTGQMDVTSLKYWGMKLNEIINNLHVGSVTDAQLALNEGGGAVLSIGAEFSKNDAQDEFFDNVYIPLKNKSGCNWKLISLWDGQADPITGKHYEYRYWPGKEDEVEISLECERNLQDGTVKPWV